MAEPNGLPPGWRAVLLGDIADLIRGISFPKQAKTYTHQRGHIACLRTTNVQKEVDWSDLWFVPKEYVKRQDQYVKEGDVLISTANSLQLVGKVAQVKSVIHEATLGAFISLIRAVGGLNSKFLYYQLASSEFQAKIRSCASTTTNISNIATAKLLNLGFVVPPASEQSRIVEKIEEVLTNLDAGVEELREAQAQLKRYRQAVLKAAVTGELTKEWREAHKHELEPASELLVRILKERRAAWEATRLARNDASPKKDGWKPEYQEPSAPVIYNLPKLPEGWTWANISRVGEVTGGLTKNPRREKLPAKIPYLRVANVYAGELDLTEVKNIGIDQTELARVLLATGDLLVVEGNGSIDQIGRVALWDGKIAPCAHQNHLIKVRFNQPKLGKYILWWLLSSEGRNFITRIASSTSGLHTLSVSKVASLPLPLPPVLEQEQIVVELERFLSIADVMQQTLDIASRQAERLRQSILKKAFEGKLAPQDPNDEPAELLLERIKIERAKREAEKQAETKSNRKRSTKKNPKQTERPAA